MIFNKLLLQSSVCGIRKQHFKASDAILITLRMHLAKTILLAD